MAEIKPLYEGVFLRLGKSLYNGKAYLGFETKNEKGSKWRTATFVSSVYIKDNSSKSEQDLKWNIYKNDDDTYYIRTFENKNYLTYNHSNNKDYRVKEWMTAEVMSSKYYTEKKYYDKHRRWKMEKIDNPNDPKKPGYKLSLDQSGDKGKLLLTINSKPERDWAKACVNTNDYFKKKGKDDSQATFYIEDEIDYP